MIRSIYWKRKASVFDGGQEQMLFMNKKKDEDKNRNMISTLNNVQWNNLQLKQE